VGEFLLTLHEYISTALATTQRESASPTNLLAQFSPTPPKGCNRNADVCVSKQGTILEAARPLWWSTHLEWDPAMWVTDLPSQLYNDHEISTALTAMRAFFNIV